MSAFIDPGFLQALLDVELALAAAEAEAGVIPQSCVADIQAAARAELYDAATLSAQSATDGNIVIPLVRQLTALVQAKNEASSRHVHRGATSQDIIDTAMVLQLREAHEMLDASLTAAMSAAARFAREHAATPIAGRTWLQHASPSTFGLKAAGWLDSLGRAHERVEESIDRALVLQLGGASGTLAALGSAGPAVAEAMARRLGLRVPDMPWHTHRDRIAEAASAFGITCGVLGKIGRDLILLAQSEVREATEGDGGGGSSSMPHKQNPVRPVIAVTAATRAPGLVSTMLSAMPQEHERAAGGWQAEWPALRELMAITLDAAAAIAASLEHLRVDATMMRVHLDAYGGIAMAEGLSTALLPHVSRKEAMQIVERLCRSAERDGRTLREVAAADPDVRRCLSYDQITHALSPDNFLGSASTFVARVLQRWSL